MKRRELLSTAAAVAASAHLPAALAQQAAFPTKPIRILVGTAPGALTDQAARLYAERMAAVLKQPVLVENVTGAGTLLAARQTAKAEPDGYTLHANANTLITVPLLNPKAGYSMKDFTAIGELVRAPLLLVVAANSPFRTVRELVAAAKAEPGKVTYASGGVGTTAHLPAELLANLAGIQLTHLPYKGVAAAIPDVVSGRVSMMLATSTSTSELLKSGALRALAVSSEARSAKFPDLPTFKESGYPGATFEVWIGLVAPARIPAVVKARLGEALQVARADKLLAARIEGAGQEVSRLKTSEAFSAALRAEEAQFAKVIRDNNITAE